MRGDVTARLKNVSILCVRSHFCRSKQWRLTVCPLHIYFSNVSTGHILLVSSHRQPPNAKYFQIISWISVTPAYLNLLFFFLASCPPVCFFSSLADWKKWWLPLIPALGRAEICLADSTADYLAEEEVRACVCLSAFFAKLCGIFFFVCLCLFPVYDGLDKDLPSFHTLFIWDEGLLGGQWVSFQCADVLPSSADDTIGVKRGLFLVSVI